MELGVLLFLMLIVIVLIFERKKFKREGIVLLRRTTRGVGFIERVGKRNEEKWNAFADFGIVLSFGIVGLWFLWLQYGREKVYKKTKKKRIALFSILYLAFTYLAYIKGGAVVEAIEEMFRIHLNAVNPLYLIYFTLAFSIIFGVSGYAFSIILLGGIAAIWNALVGAKVKAPLQLVLPFHVSSSTLPVLSVPFDKWIIALSIIVVVHEFSHAFVSAAQRIRVKSLGYGFFLVLPVGFAEPDEKALEKANILSRVRVYAAGSMANLSTAFVFGVIFFVLSTSFSGFITHSYAFKGIHYEGLVNNTSASTILPYKGVITSVNGKPLHNFSHFISVLLSLRPGDNASLEVNNHTYYVVLSHHPSNNSVAFIGILNVRGEYERRKDISVVRMWCVEIIEYLLSLLKWIVMLNIGIAIANLLPLVPLDGGLIVKDISERVMRKRRLWKYISFLTLLFLLLALFSPSVGKLIRAIKRII